jgi:hypothetical protein
MEPRDRHLKIRLRSGRFLFVHDEAKRPRIGPHLGPRTGRRIRPLTRSRIGPQEGTFARTSDGHLGWDLGFGPR